MVLVNGNWYLVHDLQDISEIVRENYNKELADEIDKLIPNHTDEEYNELSIMLRDSEYIEIDLQDEINRLEFQIEELEEKIEELEGE